MAASTRGPVDLDGRIDLTGLRIDSNRRAHAVEVDAAHRRHQRGDHDRDHQAGPDPPLAGRPPVAREAGHDARPRTRAGSRFRRRSGSFARGRAGCAAPTGSRSVRIFRSTATETPWARTKSKTPSDMQENDPAMKSRQVHPLPPSFRALRPFMLDITMPKHLFSGALLIDAGTIRGRQSIRGSDRAMRGSFAGRRHTAGLGGLARR